MLTLVIGDYKKCLEYLTKNKVKYTNNIFDSLARMSGFFKEKQSVYFIYDKTLFNTKDKAESFLKQTKNKDIYCLAENIQKSEPLYKVTKNKVQFNKAEKTKELYDLDISDLYTLLYKVKNNKDKLVFENAINYILNGTMSRHNAIQYIIINSSLF